MSKDLIGVVLAVMAGALFLLFATRLLPILSGLVVVVGGAR